MISFVKVLKKMIKRIRQTVWYQTIFVCDKELIPTQSTQSIIERCSSEPNAYRTNKIVREVKSDDILILRSSQDKDEKIIRKRQRRKGCSKKIH